MANHESTPEDPDIPYQKLVDRIDQEESRLRLADQYTSKSQANVHHIQQVQTNYQQCDAVAAIKHTINQLYTMDKQDIIKYQDHMCMAMNIIRDRHINDKRNFKGKPQFLKFCPNCGRHGHSVSKCPSNTKKDKPSTVVTQYTIVS